MAHLAAKHIANSLLDFGAYLAERDQPPGLFLQQFGLPVETLLGFSIWLDRELVLEFTHAVERCTGDPIPGFQGGALFELGNYGAWVQKAGESATLAEALRYTMLHLHELETGTRMRLYRRGATVTVQSEMVGRMSLDPRHQYEGHLCVLLKLVRLAGTSFPVTMHLPHRCRHAALAQDLTGVEIIPDSDMAALVFDAQALELPMAAVPAGPRRARTRDEAVCHEVARQICAAVDPAQISAAAIAANTALNLRTMQRRLSAWGFSFEEILDGYRKRRARELLLQGRVSITDIAHGLGYSDSAHFTRAFRRWYGVPPRAVRRDGASAATRTWSASGGAAKLAGSVARPAAEGADKMRRI